MGLSVSRLTIFAICIWLGLLLYLSAVLVRVQQGQQGTTEGGGDVSREALQRIKQAAEDIEALKKQNEELKALLFQSSDTIAKGLAPLATTDQRRQIGHLSMEHEKVRRQIENGVQELWFFVTGEVRRLQKNKGTSEGLAELLESGAEQFRTVMADVQKLAKVDGAASWRKFKLQNLTRVVQKRLEFLQNPPSCAEAKKLVCYLNKGCGFGCQIHHAAFCLMLAYASQRTLILNTRGWRYSAKGWDSVFQPISNNCLEAGAATPAQFATLNQEDKVVSVPIVESLHSRPETLPLSFPEEFAPQLLQLHGNPPAWWVGQFVWYLMRPSKELSQELRESGRRMKFSNPMVGIHVRRTDKVGAEAQFHDIHEYMRFAEEWNRIRELQGNATKRKRVFLATDEPKLFAETREKYKDYDVIGSQSAADSAKLSSRYTDASLHGLLLDIHFLSQTDYLVCTFSSQVCRVAYELMQVWREDAASCVHSLDDVYYFGGQQAHQQVAWLTHTPAAGSQELELRVGDLVGVAGNHWDGWSKGRNVRTGMIGLYPSFKVREQWRIVPYPSYPHVKV